MRKHAKIALCSAFVAVFAVIATPSTVSYSREQPDPKTDATKAVLRPELVPICSCESRQGKNGTPTHYEADGVTVLRGRENPDDVGICQINLYYHEAPATKMGLDLFKEEDNITYANWLYAKEGSTPWNWSKTCWQ